MSILMINKNNNTLYYLFNGIYYPAILSEQLALVKANGIAVLPTRKGLKRFGLCYDNVGENLTRVTYLQFLALARRS